MGLTKYKEKRHFNNTPEPTGGKAGKEYLIFVIQKHDASHLHYDFRLEMEGVLKSWAVPKGPSTDPSIKRLAMMVEDHPYDYHDFEGIIPKGNYGAGTVIVWDEGTYEPVPAVTGAKKKKEKVLLQQLHSGKIIFMLHGSKLQGEYALVKAQGRGDNGWLLMKVKDEYVSTEDITVKDKSVQSGKTLEKIAATSDNVYGVNIIQPGSTAKDKAGTNAVLAVEKQKGKKASAEKAVVSVGKRAAMPKTVSPMLATLVDKPFDKPGWIYEVKWDGYRAISLLNKDKVEILSRNNKSFNQKFYPVLEALVALDVKAALDGEIVVVDEKGMANFNALQNWRSEADGQLFYYVFDLLWLDGKDLKELPLTQRKELLQQIIPADNPIIHFSENFEADGITFFKMAEKMGLEGIMAKKADSVYIEGNRTQNWLKIKTSQRQEVVIGGYTKNEGSSKTFSSLLVGVYEKDALVYTGKIGTGFNEKKQQEMMEQFKPLVRKTSPFTTEPDVNKPSRFRPNPPKASATWLEPKLVCEVSFREMTTEGVMRHPSFEGMREDKKPAEVVEEVAEPVNKAVQAAEATGPTKVLNTPGEASRKTFLNPADETQVRIVNGHELKFSNLSKVYWPADGVTKRDMLNYYYQIAPYILPYLQNRPQTLNRFPNGINGKAFYQKDVTGKVPDWMETFLYHSHTDENDRHFLVCKDEASLLYMANLGAIELNPWSSRTALPDNPDWCVIDLDPDKNTFEQVIETAQVTKKILDAAGVPSYPKTSGSTGLHIYIPLGAQYTYEQSKEFARIIAKLVHAETSGYTSIERATANRNGKMYIDFLQNRPQATLAAPYSLRPKPGATVSMPLHWEEVKKGLQMKDFTIFNAVARAKAEGDIFKPVIGKGIDMEKAIEKIEAMG